MANRLPLTNVNGKTQRIQPGDVVDPVVLGTGTPTSLNYLRGDGSWSSPPGAGTVTSVSIVPANGISGSVTESTSTPSITLVLGDITPTSINTAGQVTSTVTTGTAPFVITSTTNIPNLNASSLNGYTFDSPGTIGDVTPSTGVFTTVSATTFTGTLNGNALTATNISGTPTLPNGTMASTQTSIDNSSKIATTAFVHNITAGLVTGVSSFNTRTGSITLSSGDVTSALTYTPPTPTGTGASGTWGISITGNAATVSTNANLTGVITSIGNVTSISNQTGTGNNFVVDTSPSLVGIPTAPTASTGTNTTQLATTAFVIAELGALSVVRSFNTRTGSITLSSGDVTSALTYTPPTPTGTGASGTWGISITGNAATSSNATNVEMTSTTTATPFPILLSPSSIGGQNSPIFDVDLTYNPSTDILTMPFGSGLITGQVTSTVATGSAPFIVSSTTPVSNLSVATAGNLIGTPLLPNGTMAVTPTNIDNSTKLATTAFVQNQGYLTSTLAASTYLPLSGGVMSGSLTLNANPVSPLSAATKAYVDASATGLNVKTPVVVATTGDLGPITVTAGTLDANGGYGINAYITNAGTPTVLTIDGVALALTDRVLVKDETNPIYNGIYTVTTVGDSISALWVLTRATNYDDDTINQISVGDYIFVQEGTTNASSSWVQTGYGPSSSHFPIIGTSSIIYTEFSAATAFSAGSGLILSSNSFSVSYGAGITSIPTGSVGISVWGGGGLMTTSDGTTPSTAVSTSLSLTKVGTAGTYPSVTTDIYGRVISGSGNVVITGGTINGTVIGSTTTAAGNFTNVGASGQITSTVSTGTPPFNVSSQTKVVNLNSNYLEGYDWSSPGAIGATTPTTGAFTTVSVTGPITSTQITGVAPFIVTSTTPVTNLSIGGNASTVTTNANLTGPITSSGNTTSVASQTGTGSKFVMDTSPTLITPIIGVATGTSFNSITGLSSSSPVMDGTAGAGAATTVSRSDHVHPSDTTRALLGGSGTQPFLASTVNNVSITANSAGFALAGGTSSKTLTVSNTMILVGTDASTLNIGTGGTLGTAAYTNTSNYSPVIGSVSISTLGTITTGVWNGTAITNANLANSSVTLGSTSVSLGSTVTSFGGVTLTSPTFTNPSLGTPVSGILTNCTFPILNQSTTGNASTATTTTNIANGAANSLVYQTALGATGFIAPGTNGFILELVSGVPTWTAPPSTMVYPGAGIAISSGSNSWSTSITPGTGVITALAQNVTGGGSIVLATSPTLVTPNLGTPSTLVGTNITGIAAGLTAGHVLGNSSTVTSSSFLTFYNLSSTDDAIRVDATYAPIPINTPSSPSNRQTFTIKKVDASTNTVTITSNAILIDGSLTIQLQYQYQSVTFYYDLTSNTWNITS